MASSTLNPAASLRVWRGKLASPDRALRWRAEAEALLAIAVFFTLFLWPATLAGRLLVSGDAMVYSYPLRTVAWEALRHGSLPLWTPFILSGYPLLSMAQLGLGYPLTWGYLFLPGYWAEQVYVLAPYLLAPAFTYAYGRELGRSRAASLLAGLSFGFGGMMASSLAVNGMFPNAVMWLPLMLIAIERARKRRFLPCLLGATGAYALSVLTGIGQAFLYAGLMTIGYAAFVSLAPLESRSSGEQDPAQEGTPNPWKSWFAWERWRPLAVCLGGMMLAASVAAFQILETMRAHRRSIRGALTYEVFSGGAFTPIMAWKSFLAPFYHFAELTTYMAPLATLLALIAVVAAILAPRSHLRLFFWLGVAALAWLLMLGDHTPLYRLAYHIPFFNRFRFPSRHAYEWSFAIAILASYGWDTMSGWLARRAGATPQGRRRDLVIGVILLGSSLAVGFGWWRATGKPPALDSAIPRPGLPESEWLLWKASFTLLVLLAVWWGLRLRRRLGCNPSSFADCGLRNEGPNALANSATNLGSANPQSKWLLIGAVMAACFLEPYILLSRWWFPLTQALASRPQHYTQVSPPARFLQNYPPEQHRIYTSIASGFKLDLTRGEPYNLSARRGFHNAAGYEPLMLERYGRAFGDYSYFSTPTLSSALDRGFVGPRSRVLDLLNVRFLVEYSAPSAKAVEKYGVRFAAADTKMELKPGAALTLAGAASAVDSLSLVTTLAHSADLGEGEPVASIIIRLADGRTCARTLVAGRDTAEWAHERPDVRPIIRHSLAPVFDSRPGDEENSFPAYRYWTRIALDEKSPVDRVEMANLTGRATLIIERVALYDSTGQKMTPLLQRLPDHWQKVYDREDVQIYQNQRALPRAWLVARAEAVDGEEALRRIRGESERAFDPKETVLLETAPAALRGLQEGDLGAEAGARIAEYEPHRLVIETRADKPSVLVLSETHYPGWAATIDGKQTSILTANYLLRGVILPAGSHRVEMRYLAPAARAGALISALTLLVLAGALVKIKIGKTKINGQR